ncbi:auxin-responsive protein SAUR50 [Selaginella moellendorffii]|uniref:auxin-responsive protein SAUR50 n=1 Tax=Selaginella moellendorffii TaxID=88036 RepID=UPI000D1C2210|nr:auxin-responsive protein SAUR50 [Selaginella moellendorffii]|eukprot:XP_024519579.1 auxin-responsive protein SAUR50 [Selaginella moellendorffii]
MAFLARIGSLLKSASIKKRSGRSLDRSSSNSSCSSLGSSTSAAWDCCYDSDLDVDQAPDSCSCSIPADVPKGCMAVIVGSCEKKRRRFVVGTHLLSNPVFGVLLQRAAEEYGYENSGALAIPCDPVLFEHFLWLLNNNDPAAAMLEVNELLAFYAS